MHVSRSHQRSRFLLDYFSHGNILDAGCGEGVFSIMMKRRGNFVWAIDMFDVSRLEHYGINFEQTTLEDYTPPEKFFDTIILMEVIEHLEDPEPIIKKLYNGLRTTSARILITTPYIDNWDNEPDHVWRWKRDELEKLLTSIAPNTTVWIDDIFIYAVMLRP
jgi:2-polyprenyl-3-methyl-5-hydroxy-6-metoxy-1,4-benzoquinol methylase